MDNRLQLIADHLLGFKEWAEFDPSSIAPVLLPHMFVLQIERDPPVHPIRLRVRLTGTELDAIFSRPLVGHCLDEFMHGPRSAEVLRGFEHCAETHEPIWMRQVLRIQDQPPRFVEGVAIYLGPDRIYGGLMVGEIARPANEMENGTFESAAL